MHVKIQISGSSHLVHVVWLDEFMTAKVAMDEGRWDWSVDPLNRTNTSNSCFEFAKDQLKVLHVSKTSIASLAIIVCGLVVFSFFVSKDVVSLSIGLYCIPNDS